MQTRLSLPQRRVLAWAHVALLVLLATCAYSLLFAHVASATDYTWGGEGSWTTIGRAAPIGWAAWHPPHPQASGQ